MKEEENKRELEERIEENNLSGNMRESRFSNGLALTLSDQFEELILEDEERKEQENEKEYEIEINENKKEKEEENNEMTKSSFFNDDALPIDELHLDQEL
jgi:hypothetical protein